MVRKQISVFAKMCNYSFMGNKIIFAGMKNVCCATILIRPLFSVIYLIEIY